MTSSKSKLEMTERRESWEKLYLDGRGERGDRAVLPQPGLKSRPTRNDLQHLPAGRAPALPGVVTAVANKDNTSATGHYAVSVVELGEQQLREPTGCSSGHLPPPLMFSVQRGITSPVLGFPGDSAMPFLIS